MMSHFITALWDPIVIGLDFAKQRGQATRERDQLCPGAETCCVQGWDLRLGRSGRVRKAFLYLNFSFGDFTVGIQG